MDNRMALPISYTVASNSNDTQSSGALTTQTFHSVTIDLSCGLPSAELARLYRMIETSLPNISNRIVQFASAYSEEGASEIAFETAVIAARLIGKRILYIDTAAKQIGTPRKLPDNVRLPLDTLLLVGRPPHEGIAQAAGTELYFAILHEREKDELSSVSISVLEQALVHLRPFFDLIILDSQAILKDAFGNALSKLTDGTILVVEAERTRAPVAEETKRLIEGSGGRIIGAILNRRRYYIPKFLYRLL
jgi:Mrp family chromosome partitioning ATPase